MSNLRILIIEDEPMLALILQEAFDVQGYETELATDGVFALEILKSYTPDIVLTDLYIPRLSGSEVIHHIRNTPTLEKVPVVVISGALQEETLNGLDYQAYIAKPFDLADVVAVVERLRLQLSQLQGDTD